MTKVASRGRLREELKRVLEGVVAPSGLCQATRGSRPINLHIVEGGFHVLLQRRDRIWGRAYSIVDIAITEPMVIGMARNLALPQADVVEGGENLPRFCQLRPRAKGRAPYSSLSRNRPSCQCGR